MVLQTDKIQPWPCSEDLTVYILPSPQDQPHTWMALELSLMWMAAQLQVFQEEMCTQLPKQLLSTCLIQGWIIPNPSVLLLMKGERSQTESGYKYSPLT